MNPNSKNFFALDGNKVNALSDIANAGGPFTTGSVLFVKDPSDVDYEVIKDQVGRDNLFDTIPAALAKTRSDMNDYVVVAPKKDGSPWDIGTALDIVNDRVHLVSLGYLQGLHGYQNTIRGFGSAALDTEVVNVTGNGVEIAGFRFLGTHGTTDDGTIQAVFKTTGSNTWLHDSVVETSAAAGASDGTVAHIGGSGFRADRVWFGNSVGIGAVKVANNVARPSFNDCTFVIDAQAVGDQFLIAGTGASEYVLVENSKFINVELGTLVASVVTGSVTVDNPWLLANNTYVNVTQAGTDPTVWKAPATSGTAASVRDLGIAVGTAALTPV